MNRWVASIMRGIHVGMHATQQESVKSYEEAVRALNTMQSNAAYLEKTKAERDLKRFLSLPETLEIAKRVGITPEDLDTLSVIHVSGTKGKGSTCALCESVLREHGYKTGFFSSPHLVEVRERIRLNGRPLSRDAFSTYFWECFHPLEDTKDQYNGAMPPYFRFLTVMALQVFLKEKVDVAILEVGIGGEYDCTNIVRTPVVCGVTSLGIDHTSLLGDTLEKIAWHKAGIFKPGVPALTVPQPGHCMDVLENRAKEIGCPVYEVPKAIECYENLTHHQMPLGIDGEKQKENASLALQLCKIWLENHKLSEEEKRVQYASYLNGMSPPHLTKAPPFPVPESMAKGLRECKWPGRCQTLCHDRVTYYIDGAHTPRSIEACVSWFLQASKDDAKKINGRIARVLLFNATGDRKPETLLQPLLACNFDCAIFTPNMIQRSTNSADQTNHTVTLETQLSKVRLNRNVWLDLITQERAIEKDGETCEHATDEPCPIHACMNGDDAKSNICQVQGKRQKLENGHADGPHTSHCESTERAVNCLAKDSHSETQSHPALTFSNIVETLEWVSQGKDPVLPNLPPTVDMPIPDTLQNADHIQVLCTGSLHLVGGVLGLLDPDICDK